MKPYRVLIISSGCDIEDFKDCQTQVEYQSLIEGIHYGANLFAGSLSTFVGEVDLMTGKADYEELFDFLQDSALTMEEVLSREEDHIQGYTDET